MLQPRPNIKMSFKTDTDTDTLRNSINVYFKCKSCEFTFSCPTVEEFLDHKIQEHFAEFQKTRCIVFEEKKNDAMVFNTDQNTETEGETKLFEQDDSDGDGDVDQFCSGSDMSEIFEKISEPTTLKPLPMHTQALKKHPIHSHEFNAEVGLFSVQSTSMNSSQYPLYLENDLIQSNSAHTESVPYLKNNHMDVEISPAAKNMSPVPGIVDKPRDLEAINCALTKKTFNRIKNPYVLIKRLTSKEILSSNFSSNRKSKLGKSNKFKILNSTSTKKEIRGTVLFSCPICSNSYNIKSSLSSHIKIHYGFKSEPRLNKCPYLSCPSSFKTKDGLRRHKKRHENAISNPELNSFVNKPYFMFPKPDNDISQNQGDPLTLREWLVKQKSLEDLNSSETVNIIRLDPDPTTETEEKANSGVKISAENPIKCKFCTKNLETEAEVKVHVMHCWLQNKQKHRYCLPCNKTLSTPQSLRSHNTFIHNPLGRKQGRKSKPINQVKPVHQCPLCPLKAKKPSRLKRHMETHKREEERSRPFVCEICGLASYSLENFNRHRLIHGEERTFKCSHPNCAAAFRTSQARNSHLKSHAVSKLFTCPKEGCSQQFKSKSGLSYHLKSSCHPSHPSPDAGSSNPRSENVNNVIVENCIVPDYLWVP